MSIKYFLFTLSFLFCAHTFAQDVKTKKSSVKKTLSPPPTPTIPQKLPEISTPASPGAPSDDKAESLWVLDQMESKVILRVTHNPFGRFDTTGKNALEGQIAVSADQSRASAKEIKFKVDALQSLITLRDSHIKQHLDMKNHPTIAVTDFSSPIGKSAKSKSQLWTGMLRVKGKTSPIKDSSGVLYFKGEDVLVGSFQFSTMIGDFDIALPIYKGVFIEKKVELLVDFVAQPHIDHSDDPKL